jgi:pimeloyl-ACP methyl ester carboxylesterase
MKMSLALLLANLVASPTLAAEATIPKPPPNSFVNATSRFAIFGTNKVHYTTLGNGSNTVVFIHGWAGSTDVWRLQVPALAGKARLLLIDLPGHGKSDKPQTAYTMEFFARAVGAVLTDTKVDKAVLAGFSMGTPVICRFYRQFPDKVQALVAVDGSLRGFDTTDEQREQFIGPYRGQEYRERATKFIGAMFPNPGTEALRDRVLEDVRNTPQHVLVSAFEGMFDKAAWEPEKITVPLLVVNAKSPFWTEDYESYVRKLQSKADYHMIEGTGHFLMLERPAEFNAMLVGFLQKNGFISK